MKGYGWRDRVERWRGGGLLEWRGARVEGWRGGGGEEERGAHLSAALGFRV